MMEELGKILENNELPIDLEFRCHDCGEAVRVRYSEDEGGGRLDPQDGSAGYNPVLNNGHHEYFVKCASCFEKNPQLRSYNPAEVYTRVVGYYRPISSFNRGKQEEVKIRQDFKGPDTIMQKEEV